MKKSIYLRFLLLITLLPAFIFTNAQPTKVAAHTPAEWEPQQSVWIIWPEDSGAAHVTLQLIRELISEVKVNIVFSGEKARDFMLLDAKRDSMNTSMLKLHIQKDVKGFARDWAPWFVTNASGKTELVEFAKNNFGIPPDSAASPSSRLNPEEFTKTISSQNKLPVKKSDVVLENGMIDINSKGIAVCYMETILQRNPDKDLVTITNELKEKLGLKSIIWLGSAPTIDKFTKGPRNANIYAQGANGHIDHFVRFANDTVILFSTIDDNERRYDPVSSADYFILNEGAEVLKNVISKNEMQLRIYELPVPVMRFHLATDTVRATPTDSIRYRQFIPGDIVYFAPNVSYLNFFICNNKVFLPAYYRDGLPESEKRKDDLAGALFEQLYPGKKIVRINPVALNLLGAGLRRMVIQQPLQQVK